MLVKYATTDGDGRSAEGFNDALTILTPLWRVERLADTIHLGQSQFKYAIKAAFSPNMFSPMGRSNQTKLYQYKKGFSLDVKARCHLIFHEDAVQSIRFNTNTNTNEVVNQGLSVSLPNNVNFSRNGNGRAHAAVHRMNNVSVNRP